MLRPGRYEHSEIWARIVLDCGWGNSLGLGTCMSTVDVDGSSESGNVSRSMTAGMLGSGAYRTSAVDVCSWSAVSSIGDSISIPGQ